MVYKLTDFGYAKVCDQNSICNSIVGTTQYVAPEVIRGYKYNSSVSVWKGGGGREEGGRGGGGRVFGWPNFTEGSYLVALQTCISLNDSEGCKNVVVNTTCPESLRAHTPGV